MKGLLRSSPKQWREGLSAVIGEYIESFDKPAPAPLAEFIS